MSDENENNDQILPKTEPTTPMPQVAQPRVEEVRVEETTLTISEFKFWIEGIKEMQPNDWTPNREQWDLVLRKIYALEPTVVERIVEKEVQVQVQPQQQMQYPQQHHQHQQYPQQHHGYPQHQGYQQHAPAPVNHGGVPQSQVIRSVDEQGNEVLVSTAKPIDGRPVEQADGSTKSTFG